MPIGRRAAAKYAVGPTRVQYQNKDPSGWREFAAHWPITRHAARRTRCAGFRSGARCSSSSLTGLRRIAVPTLILTGDEDEPCSRPDLLMKRSIPRPALW